MDERRYNSGIQAEQHQDVDLREFDGGKFIHPSPAEGSDVSEVKAKEFVVPVSLTIKDGRFRINGVENKTNKGVIISGVITGDKVNINHIELAEGLRGTGVSHALLTKLEIQLQKRGTKTVYASFANPVTVDFLAKNSYSIIPFESLSEEEEERKSLGIKAEDFDHRVNSVEDYNKLKETKGSEFRKILLAKQIG